MVTVPVGMPTVPEINQVMSHLLAGKVADGEYARLSQKAYQNYTRNVCVERDAMATVVQFDLESMAGPLVLLFMISVLSLIITRFGQRYEKRAEAIKKSLDTDNDGYVSKEEFRKARAVWKQQKEEKKKAKPPVEV